MGAECLPVAGGHFVKAIFCSMLFVIASVSLMTAQGTYTQIDFPGALATVPTGVNAHGDIVGYYVDSTGNTDGFLLSGGSYTTIMYPGAASTQLSGINDSGKIVGFSDASNSGFQYDEFTQTFTTITYPHANQTLPTAINNSGTVVGTIDYGLNDNLGFESVGSKFRRIAPPASSQVFLTGIAGSGQIVGTVFGFFLQAIFCTCEERIKNSKSPMHREHLLRVLIVQERF
jgi:hypothetical protein